MSEQEQGRSTWNACRFSPGDRRGHYESYFQRANHPDRPLAFWIRYTIFSPQGRPEDAVGELWAIFFDGQSGQITAVKETMPLAHCEFSDRDLRVRLGTAVLTNGELEGKAASHGHEIAWSLTYQGDARPLLLLPERLYGGRFPKAKALVGTPNALYRGTLIVDGREIDVAGWVGSQNHNWGSEHTHAYAWGQVAGFDDAPDAFLECSTARVKLGPISSPWLTLLVLRIGDEEFALNSLAQAMRARGHYRFFRWEIESVTRVARVTCQIEAPPSAFVGLAYDNPPGGRKTCLNTKLASCKLVLERPGRSALRLATRHRAAFEILTDRRDHGVPIVA